MKKINFLNRHLSETGENYLEHFLFAFSIAMWTLVAGIIFLFHAIFPFVFTIGGSWHIKKINEVVQKRFQFLSQRRAKADLKSSHEDAEDKNEEKKQIRNKSY